MIRNRLAVLLAERGLKITQVAKDTGISRNTITSTSQNDGKMIQLETIDVLCQYLNVTPGEFFEYVPMKIKYSAFTELNFNSDTHSNDIAIEAYIDVKRGLSEETIAFNGVLVHNPEEVSYEGMVKVDEKDKANLNALLNVLSAGFASDIKKDFEDVIVKELEKLPDYNFLTYLKFDF